MNKSSSIANLFSASIGKTIISTHIVGVIKNKEELFLYSLSISFLIRDLFNFI